MVDDFDDLLGAGAPLPASAAPPTADLVPAVVGGEQAFGPYEGASRFEQDLATWNPSRGSADLTILPSKEMSDARSKDMARNDAFIQGGVTLHKDNIVGAQFMLNAKPSSRVLFGKQDDAWEGEFQEEVEETFDLLAESPENFFCASRLNTFTDLIRLGVGVHTMGGEMFATVPWFEDGRPFNTAIQMVDLDRLSTPYVKQFDPNIRAGVERDRRGRPINYYVRKVHPDDFYPTFQNLQDMYLWDQIPAQTKWGRRQAIHLFNQMRPEQTRGISEMTAALKAGHITHNFRDLNLQKAVAQSLFAAVITADMPTEVIMQKLGIQGEAADIQKALSAYMAGHFQTIDQFCGGASRLKTNGVRIPHLPPGAKLEMVTPDNGAELGMEFEQSLLRYMAASLGVSYEQLSRDYTNTNYSSARAAMSETWKFMQARKKECADRFATMIYRLWLEEMVSKNLLTTFPKAKAAMLYTNGALGLKFEALSRCEWIGASRGQIDELKETQAAVLRINSGLSTAESELARLGQDWRKVYRQIKREQTMRDALGILQVPVDTSSMMNAATGKEPATGKKPADSGTTKKKAAA